MGNRQPRPLPARAFNAGLSKGVGCHSVFNDRTHRQAPISKTNYQSMFNLHVAALSQPAPHNRGVHASCIHILRFLSVGIRATPNLGRCWHRLHMATLLALVAIAASTPACATFGADRLTSAATSTSAAPGALLARALRAWRDQQQLVRSARFKWKYNSFKPVEEQRRFAASPIIKQKLKIPVSELRESKIAQERILAFESSHTRYEERGAVNLGGSNDYWERERISVFDGQKNVTLTPNSFTRRDKSDLRYTAVDIENVNPEVVSSNLIPLFLAFRMFDQSVQRLIDPTTISVDMQHPLPDTNEFLCHAGNWTISVSPMYNFAITRYSKLTDDRKIPIFETTIDYAKNDRGFWVPRSWRSVFFTPKGELRTEETSTVVESQINPQLPPSTFKLDIPAESYVRDTRGGEMLTAIQLPDGRQFPVPATMPYREAFRLAKMNIGPSFPADRSRHPVALIIALNVIFILAVCAAFVYRHKKGKAKPL
jgi:hypothetical protein